MNIINKLHILKDAAVIAREKFNPTFCKKFNQNFWGNIFQALQKCIKESEDEEKLSSAYSFLAKHWPKMHEASVDLEEIVQVLHPLDIIEQFEVLQDAGAHLNINQITLLVPYGHDKIDLHRLHSLNADMDQIAHHYNLKPCSFDEINDLINNGVSALTTFVLSEDYFLSRVDHPHCLFNDLRFFYKQNIGAEQIRRMINKIIPVKFIYEPNLPHIANLINEIVRSSRAKWCISSRDEWCSIGVNPNEYVKPWICLYRDNYLGIEPGETLKNLPFAVSVRDFIKNTGLSYILREVNYRGLTFKQFIDCNYLPAEGDIEELAKEANYAGLQYDDPTGWLVLAYLSDSGSKLVSREKLLEYGNPSNYTESEDYDFAKRFMEDKSAQ